VLFKQSAGRTSGLLHAIVKLILDGTLGMHRNVASDWLYVHALTNPWMSMDRGESWKRRPKTWSHQDT
jgi:hypothetical protein